MKISLDASFIALQRRSAAEPAHTSSPASTTAQSTQASSSLDTSGLPSAIAFIADRMASNPDPADMDIVELYANEPEQQLVNISDPGNITYTGNGEPVTASNTAAFQFHAAAILPQKQAILQQGLAQGQSPAQIFVSLARFIHSQPQSYLEEMDWFGK